MFKSNKFPFAKVSAAFVVGAVAGAATALLLAPMKGKKLQKKVANAIEDQVDNVEKLIKKVV
ncbi:MAG: YtxH domain-containing protein [Thermoanaerobaculia bacterium]